MEINQGITIPQSDLLAGLEQAINETISIIIRPEYGLNKAKMELLEQLGHDAIYFLNVRAPINFIVYVTVALRAIIEEGLQHEDYNLPDSMAVDGVITEGIVKELTRNPVYKSIQVATTSSVHLKQLLPKEESRLMLMLSSDAKWHGLVWDLNDNFGGTESNIRKFKSYSFLKSIANQFSLKESDIKDVLDKRRDLYKILSKYVHVSSEIQPIISTITKNIKGDTIDDKEKTNVINFVGQLIGGLSIFKRFEITTTDKISMIDVLVDGQS